MANDEMSAEDLLAIVAHDLKSPISAVRGYIDLVQQSGDLNERQQHYCRRAMAGLDRMETMVSSLLEMSRLEDNELTLHLEDCHLGEIVKRALQLLEASAAPRGIQLHLEVDPEEPIVYGDERLLDLVINNLLTNAIKYNRDSGSVWIRVTNQPEMVQLDVKDTGHGIPDTDQPFIFDRFYRARSRVTTQTSGSGLGLTIVKTIIQKHDGVIWFHSVEGEGSTFSLSLPRRRHDSQVAGENEESAWGTGAAQDPWRHAPHEASIEEHDGVDDNLQEARHLSETDSSSDEV